MNHVFTAIFVAVQIATAILFLRVVYSSNTYRRIALSVKSPSSWLITGVMYLAIGGIVDVLFWAFIGVGPFILPDIWGTPEITGVIVTLNALIKLIPALLISSLWDNISS